MVFWRVMSDSTRPTPGANGYAVDTWYGINGQYYPGTSQAGWFPFRNFDTTLAINSGDSYCTQLNKLWGITRSADLVLLFDGLIVHSQNPNALSVRHNNNQLCNLLFADGHAASLASKELPKATADFNKVGATPKWRLDLQ
jgi:prepilin-type processing-associated H-X9-DG protein